MKRSEALAHLSRDHHRGLVAAQRLRRATPEDARAARDAFLAFWEQEGRDHFRSEEELLLPAVARHVPPTHEAVVRVLTDHVDLRRRALEIRGDDPPECAALHELGDRLHAHIRHEERVLFPLIEAALTTEELIPLAEALDAAER